MAKKAGKQQQASIANIRRPKGWGEVIGQEAAVAYLKSVALGEAPLPKSIALYGPPGTGKTTLANLLAMTNHCVGEGEDPCNTCSYCTNRTDIFSFTVKNAADSYKCFEEALEYAKTKSIHGLHKFIILDEIQNASSTSMRVLLDALENGYEGVTFIIISMQPQKMDEETRAAISSRCVVQYLSPLSQESICEMLGGDELAHRIAFYANGNARSAYSILQSLPDGEPDTVDKVYGGNATPSQRKKLWELINKGDVTGVKKHISRWSTSKEILFSLLLLDAVEMNDVEAIKHLHSYSQSFIPYPISMALCAMAQAKVNPLRLSLDELYAFENR